TSRPMKRERAARIKVQRKGSIRCGRHARSTMASRDASRLLLPPALGRLLPVGDGAAGGSRARPLLACARDRGGIAAFEQIDDARVGREISRPGAGDEKAYAGAIGVVLRAGQVYGLQRRVPITLGAVRQKALVAVGPQERVERLHALLRARLHDRAPAPLQRALHKARKHPLERLVLKVIE